MNTWSIIFIASGILYIIHSIYFKNDVTLYISPSTQYYIQNTKYIKIQLIVGILNSIILIVSGLLIRVFTVKYVFLMIFPLIFSINNFLLFTISKKRGYIKKYSE